MQYDIKRIDIYTNKQGNNMLEITRDDGTREFYYLNESHFFELKELVDNMPKQFIYERKNHY